MWIEFPLQLRFTTPLCGGVPRDDELVDDWIRARAASDSKLKTMPEAQTLDQVTAERQATTDTLDEEIEQGLARIWVGFSRDENGLFLRGANMRAHLKDCASVLARGMKLTIPPLGCTAVKQFKAKLADAIYIKEDRLYVLHKDGEIYQAATQYRDATLSVFTAQGPRQCMKRIDMCFPASLRCTVQLLESSEIDREHIVACLEYGKVHGFGQDRSLQYGRYEYTLGDYQAK